MSLPIDIAVLRDHCHRPAKDGKPPGVYGFAIYFLLASYADGKGGPSLRRIADDAGLSVRQVAYTLQRMEDIGLIQRQRQRNDDGGNAPTMYALLNPELR